MGKENYRRTWFDIQLQGNSPESHFNARQLSVDETIILNSIPIEGCLPGMRGRGDSRV